MILAPSSRKKYRWEVYPEGKFILRSEATKDLRCGSEDRNDVRAHGASIAAAPEILRSAQDKSRPEERSDEGSTVKQRRSQLTASHVVHPSLLHRRSFAPLRIDSRG